MDAKHVRLSIDLTASTSIMTLSPAFIRLVGLNGLSTGPNNRSVDLFSAGIFDSSHNFFISISFNFTK
jgi:hypothetical protein